MLAVRRVDEIRVAGTLQRDVRPMTRAQHVDVGMQLVRALDRPRARHRHRVTPAGASLGRDQMVVAVALVEVRRFGESERRAGEDDAPLADQPLLRGRVLLQDDAGEAVLAGTVIPQHVEQVLPPVVVVEERRIEAAAVEIDRIGPVAVDVACS